MEVKWVVTVILCWLEHNVGEQLELIKLNQDVVVGLTAVSDPDALGDAAGRLGSGEDLHPGAL